MRLPIEADEAGRGGNMFALEEPVPNGTGSGCNMAPPRPSHWGCACCERLAGSGPLPRSQPRSPGGPGTLHLPPAPPLSPTAAATTRAKTLTLDRSDYNLSKTVHDFPPFLQEQADDVKDFLTFVHHNHVSIAWTIFSLHETYSRFSSLLSVLIQFLWLTCSSLGHTNASITSLWSLLCFHLISTIW